MPATPWLKLQIPARVPRGFLSKLLVLCSVSVFAPEARAEEQLDVLFLSKSSGYEHAVIKRSEGDPSRVEMVLGELAEQHGFGLSATKDAGSINAADLQDVDVVIFYTTGDLTKSGGTGAGIFRGDGEGAMGKDGVTDLIKWVEAGGGFVAFHSASDTFKNTDLGLADDAVTPYVEMLGAQFRAHGPRNFAGQLMVIDPDHPVAAGLKDGAAVVDEWYAFSQLATDRIHAVALLDAGAEKDALPKVYGGDPYPVIWTMERGEGRVYYNAMGHREDVWTNPLFQGLVVDAILWAGGEGATQSSPNLSVAHP